MKPPYKKLLIAALSTLLSGAGTGTAVAQQEMTAQLMVETIIDHVGAEKVENTVDIIKAGNPDTPVKGIATCMFATMEVLREAARQGCNLVITHEPLYYNHLDSADRFQGDSVYLEKRKFIEDNGLVVWRFHDYIHRLRPDGVMVGLTEKLGWAKYQSPESPYHFTFPGIPLEDLLKDLKSTFPGNPFHVVGDPKLTVRNVAYVPGASGSEAHLGQLRRGDIDVVVAGEVPQWETYEYVRDAVAQGRKKAFVLLGHINSEEYGMKYCADWLGTFVPDLPIRFITTGSSYWSY